jgi:hypothetical protein
MGFAVAQPILPRWAITWEVFDRGHSVTTDPCGVFSEHGYAGIEQKVVKEIAEFVRGKDKD